MGPKVGLWWGDGLFWGWKAHRIMWPNVPGRRDPLLEDGNTPIPLDHAGASLLSLGLPLFGWSLLLFIPLFRSSSSYTCQSSMPILKCTSPQPFFLVLCKLLWPPSPCPGVTSTSKGVGVNCVYLIQRWQLFLGLPPHLFPLWLAHMAWNLFCNPRVDVLRRCGVFFSHDFGLPRIGSSSAVHSNSLDSLHSSPGTSFSSTWALSLEWNGPKPLGPSGPTIAPQNYAARLLGRGGGFWCPRA